MRESCIAHKQRQPIAIVREDYYQLMDRDCVAAAILNIFEYWANAEIARNPDIDEPWVGERTISEFQRLLLGISTDKQIRARLKQIEQRGFIETKQESSTRKTRSFKFCINNVQSALDRLNTEKANGQITADTEKANGQITADTEKANGQITVSSLFKEDLYLKEGFKEREERGSLTENERDRQAEMEPESKPKTSATVPSLDQNPTTERSTGEDQLSGAAARENATQIQKFERNFVGRGKRAGDEEFTQWWEGYRKFCFATDASPGSEDEAWEAWKDLAQDQEAFQRLLEGTQLFVQQKRDQLLKEGKAIGIPGAKRFLRERYFLEAIDRAEIKTQIPDLDKTTRKRIEAEQAADEAYRLLKERYPDR